MVTMLYSLSIQNQSFDKRFHETEDMVQFVLYHKGRVGGLSTDCTVLGVSGGAQNRGRTDRAREVGKRGFSERRQETSSLSGSKHAKRSKNGPKGTPFNKKAVTQLEGTVLISSHSLTGLHISWERLIAISFVTDALFPTCMAVLLSSSLLSFFHYLIFPKFYYHFFITALLPTICLSTSGLVINSFEEENILKGVPPFQQVRFSYPGPFDVYTH